MLTVSGAHFSYGERTVLRDVNLRVGASELVCIVGANGVGKTTLLKLIGGLLQPAQGSVRCFDLDPAHTKRHVLARKLSYLPQSYQLSFPFRVSDVVLMGRYAHHGRGVLGLDKDEDVEAARTAMERCDVLHLADRPFDAVSGGEQRRALLAQAFCQRSELVLLDEPTSALDPAHAMTVFAALVKETDERAASAIAVTHDLNLAARYATRLIVIDECEIVADGEPREVLESAATTKAFRVPMHVDTLPTTDIPFVVPGVMAGSKPGER